LKTTIPALLEFRRQEHLAGLRIMPRTFFEAFVPLPVTIRKRPDEIIKVVALNTRDPEMNSLYSQGGRFLMHVLCATRARAGRRQRNG